METKSSNADSLKNDTTDDGSCCSSGGGDKAAKKKSDAFPQEHFDLTEEDALPGMYVSCASVRMHVCGGV